MIVAVYSNSSSNSSIHNDNRTIINAIVNKINLKNIRGALSYRRISTKTD